MIQAYEQFRVDGLLPVSHEIVYGHAWVPEAKSAESVVVPFQKFLKSGRFENMRS